MKKSILIRVLLVISYVCVLPFLLFENLELSRKIYLVALLVGATISANYFYLKFKRKEQK